jgi:type IV secretory pathway VirB4 component
MFSEVLEFLAFLIDGEWRRFPLPRAEINDIALQRPGRSSARVALCRSRGRPHTQYGGMVTIQEYPALTCPGILNDFSACRLNSSCRSRSPSFQAGRRRPHEAPTSPHD